MSPSSSPATLNNTAERDDGVEEGKRWSASVPLEGQFRYSEVLLCEVLITITLV